MMHTDAEHGLQVLTRYMAVECPMSDENLARMRSSGGPLTVLVSQ